MYKQQGFGIIEVILVVATVGLIGGLGWAYYNQSQTKQTGTTANTSAPNAEQNCADNETIAAINGTFCSQEIGIKFDVPALFKGKLTQSDNYEVRQGGIDPSTETSAGKSELVFKTEITGNDNFRFSIAKEPLRSGYIGVLNALQSTYFNKDSGTLNNINGPTNSYDSATGVTTTSGTYSVGALVPSFTVDGVRLYEGSDGDAGTQAITYFGVVKNKIIKITLAHQAYMGDPAQDPTTIDANSVFRELKEAMRKLQVV